MESYGTPQVRALTLASRAFFEQPPEGFAEHPLLGARGAMMVASHGQEAPLHEHWAVLQPISPRGRLLDAAETCALVPVLRREQVIGAVHEPEASDMDVHAIHQGFLARHPPRRRRARWSMRRSPRFAARASVWQVQAGAHALEAPLVVNAAGAWADADRRARRRPADRPAAEAPLGLHLRAARQAWPAPPGR